MADDDLTPANLLFLAASNPALAATASDEWNRCFADWLMKTALERADNEFGENAKSDNAYDLVKLRLEDTYGRDYAKVAAAEMRAAYQIAEAADDLHYKEYQSPMWDAAVALALVPAPNLPAAMFKVELIKREELDNFTRMPRDPMEIVREDMARLQAEQA